MESKLLPHGEAFLFFDEILSANVDEVVGTYIFKQSHKIFQGKSDLLHVPQVMLIESIIQCGGAGVRKTGFTNGLFGLVKVDIAKFLEPVYFDQMVTYKIKNIHLKKDLIVQKGKGYIDAKPVLEASWSTVRIKK
ncbi:beta-hydroxyacyl-ACP dehydratase [Reichenbachiella sp. MALMAid0571]|uniref:3-hydroxyacyl-ACP dehydratase FabZ family protein n=1 Tax=Reichenbachiella sp. MALMAid0571 TaxID=3143939 RepID=UPI0032DF764A